MSEIERPSSEIERERNVKPRPRIKAARHARAARYALVALALVGVVLAFSPRGQIPPDLGTGIGDKAAHAVFAGILGLLLAAALPRTSSLLLLLGIVACAALVEIVQPIFGRGADFDDGLMTVLGGCAGYAFARLVRGREATE